MKKILISATIILASPAIAETLSCVDRQPDGGVISVKVESPYSLEYAPARITETVGHEVIWTKSVTLKKSYAPNDPYEIQLTDGSGTELVIFAPLTDTDKAFTGELKLKHTTHKVSCTIN